MQLSDNTNQVFIENTMGCAHSVREKKTVFSLHACYVMLCFTEDAEFRVLHACILYMHSVCLMGLNEPKLVMPGTGPPI